MLSKFLNVLTDFLYYDLENRKAYVLATLISTIYVFSLYPLHFIMGDAAYFQSEDIAQHISGWLAYAADEWRWPIFFTNRINYPSGVSIAFTDSIPLMAIFFKPFVKFFPENFHYFGIWQGLAFLSQGIAAVFLMRALGVRHLLSLIAALGFALTWPSLMWRTAHTSLMTHSLILAGLGFYFCGRSGRWSFQKTTVAFFVLCTLALLIHPYFIPLCFLIFLAYLGDDLRPDRTWRSNLRWAAVLGLWVAILAKILGYLGGSTAGGGFGQFSLNLAAPFCGGYFTPCFKDATGGQGEGFNYFGVGLIFLAVAGLIGSRRNVVSTVKQCPALFVIALMITFYALSNKIYFQEYLIVDYHFPGFARSLASTFRASGRFFWVVGYLVLFFTLSLWLKQRRLYIALIIGMAMTVQAIDLQPFRNRLVGSTDPHAALEDKRWEPLLARVREIKIYPVFGCATAPSNLYIRYQLLATQHKKLLNTAYIARSTPNCEDKTREFYEDFSQGALYIMPVEYLEKPSFMLPDGFLKAIQQGQCVEFEHTVLCRSDKTRHEWQSMGFVKTITPGQLSRASFQWSARELPTAVGMLHDNQLVAVEGNKGYLSFGPYAMLSAGSYKISITYSSRNGDPENPNTWDIVRNEEGKLQVLEKGVFITAEGNGGRVVTTLQLQHASHKLEIRSYYQGKGKFQIENIVVEKI